MTMPDHSRERCLSMDDADPLAAHRERFELPNGVIYLDGNSLGPLPRGVAQAVTASIEHDWGRGLIRSWNDAGWFELPQRLGGRLAPLMGADPDEVVVTDSTSINLHKVLSAALSLRPERRCIVSEVDNFPTDLYIAEGIAERGLDLRLLGKDANSLEALIDDDVAVLMLTHVNFKSARIHEMKTLTQLAQERGALVIWDLAHSLGAVSVDLNDAGADFAVGCTYKYLNGGPGAPAFAFVARRHHGIARQPLTGWFGHSKPFAFSPSYDAANDIRQFLCGTPPVLSMIALDRALDVFADVDVDVLRTKSIALTSLFIDLVTDRLPGMGFSLRSPEDAAERGSHVSIAHKDGYAIIQALIDSGVIGDFRSPDNLRFGFAPLFNRYVEVWDAIEILRDIMLAERWREPQYQVRHAVT